MSIPVHIHHVPIRPREHTQDSGMSSKETTPITLDEIAKAIQQHVLLGTLDVDYLNTRLWPAVSVIHQPGNAKADESRPDASTGSAAKRRAKRQAEEESYGSKRPRKRLSSRDRSGSGTCGQGDSGARATFPSTLHQNVHTPGDMSDSNKGKEQAQCEAPGVQNIQPTVENSVQTHTGEHLSIATPLVVATKDGSESHISARAAFVGKWATKISMVSDWKKLDKLAYIGKRPDQAPFQVLDFLMARLCDFGSQEVLTSFKHSVEVWIEKQSEYNNQIQVPAHLVTVDGFDATPFQRFWKANQSARNARGAEGIAIILRRKAIVDQLAAYEDVVQLIKVAIGERRIKLRHGEIAASKARQILFNILYKDVGDRSSMRNMFEYDRTCAFPYMTLCQHYGNQGIIAMVPLKVRETDFQVRARPPAMAAILDLLRPEFHGPILALYSDMITMVAAGQTPTPQMMADLDRWTSIAPERVL